MTIAPGGASTRRRARPSNQSGVAAARTQAPPPATKRRFVTSNPPPFSLRNDRLAPGSSSSNDQPSTAAREHGDRPPQPTTKPPAQAPGASFTSITDSAEPPRTAKLPSPYPSLAGPGQGGKGWRWGSSAHNADPPNPLARPTVAEHRPVVPSQVAPRLVGGRVPDPRPDHVAVVAVESGARAPLPLAARTVEQLSQQVHGSPVLLPQPGVSRSTPRSISQYLDLSIDHRPPTSPAIQKPVASS